MCVSVPEPTQGPACVPLPQALQQGPCLRLGSRRVAGLRDLYKFEGQLGRLWPPPQLPGSLEGRPTLGAEWRRGGGVRSRERAVSGKGKRGQPAAQDSFPC